MVSHSAGTWETRFGALESSGTLKVSIIRAISSDPQQPRPRSNYMLSFSVKNTQVEVPAIS